jgi:hypothetical protein
MYEEITTHHVAKDHTLHTGCRNRKTTATTNSQHPIKFNVTKGLTYRNMSNLSHCYGWNVRHSFHCQSLLRGLTTEDHTLGQRQEVLWICPAETYKKQNHLQHSVQNNQPIVYSVLFIVCCLLFCVHCSFYCSLFLLLFIVLRFFNAFSSVVRQMPGYNSQRRGTARTSQFSFLCIMCTVCV